MSREWKPGDMALVDCVGEDRLCSWATECHKDVHPREPHWHVARSHTYIDDDGRATRPLVVIDPEDREQVERLVAPLRERGASVGRIPAPDGRIDWDAELVAGVQAALRSLVTPPKPDEPQGRYAVVEDNKALEWVRADVSGLYQWHSIEGAASHWKGWNEINVVRILSEGVQP